MKKNTLFLSAAITTFILVIVATLILKVKTLGLASPVAAASAAPAATNTLAPTDTLQPTDTATLAPTATSAFISPQEAVTLASKALGNTQIYSVDTETRYGKDVYKVTFSSGHIVFVNPEGIILAIISPQSAYVAPTPDQQSSGGGGGGGGGGGRGSGDDGGGHDN
jgi:uncharacterized membrane protein YgcG